MRLGTVMHAPHSSSTVGKNHVQLDQCILHPKAHGFGSGVNEQHACSLGHIIAVHQALCTFLGLIGDFDRKGRLPPIPTQGNAVVTAFFPRDNRRSKSPKA